MSGEAGEATLEAMEVGRASLVSAQLQPMVPTPWWRVRRSLEAATPALLLLLLLATSLAIALASAALYRTRPDQGGQGGQGGQAAGSEAWRLMEVQGSQGTGRETA